MKNKVLLTGFALLAIAGVAVTAVTVVQAYVGGNPSTVIENAENINISGGADVDASEGIAGGSTSDDWSVGGALTVTGATTLSSALDTGRLTQGGDSLASSTTATAGTLTAAELATYSVIDYTPNTGATTLTLPATSTMTTLIPNDGDSTTFLLNNATSTAAATITVAAGTGVDLIEPDGQNVVIAGGNQAQITLYRQSDTDVYAIVDEFIAAD